MKKIISLFLCAILLTAVFSIAVSAASVTISASQSSAESGTVYGTWKYYGGLNNKGSERTLRFSARYYSLGLWVNDVHMNVPPGGSFSMFRTITLSSPTNWKLHLNPLNTLFGGCLGSGSIIYD